jgi:hypothetical protein
LDALKLPRNQVAGAEMADTWDEEEDNETSLILDWATVERIAATDPVVIQLIADIDGGCAAEHSARESSKEHIFNPGRILFQAEHQLSARGYKI